MQRSVLTEFVVVYHDIVIFPSCKIFHDLRILETYVRYYNGVTFNPLCKLLSKLSLFGASSYLVLPMMHVGGIGVGYIYYSKISVDLVIRDKFCWLITVLVQ